jgi:hypothetical protein
MKKRTAMVSVRINEDAKLRLNEYKRQNNMSLADVIEDISLNKLRDQEEKILIKKTKLLTKLEYLEEQKSKNLKEKEDIDSKLDFVKKELNNIEKNEVGISFVSKNTNDVSKEILKSIYETINRHTRLSGELTADFDPHHSIKQMCNYRGVPSELVISTFDLIEKKELNLDEVLADEFNFDKIKN